MHIQCVEQKILERENSLIKNYGAWWLLLKKKKNLKTHKTIVAIVWECQNMELKMLFEYAKNSTVEC